MFRILQHRANSAWVRFGFAIFTITLAAALRIWPLQALGSSLAWLTFYPAVMIAALVGGIYAGFLATALSIVIVTFFWPLIVSTPLVINFAHWLGTAIFVLSCCMVSIVAELMHRAQKRAAIAEQQADTANRTRVLFDNSPISMVAVDPKNMRVVQANYAALETWGYSVDEFKSRTITDLTYPDDLQQTQQLNKQLANGEIDRINYEKRYIRKDGSFFWADTTVSSVKDVQGIPVLFIGSSIDITEHKSADAAISKASQKLQIALEGSQISVWELNTSTNEVWLDATWSTFLGKPSSETHTTFEELLSIVHPDDRSAIISSSVQTLKDETEMYFVEHRVMSADGQWKWVLSRGRVVERNAEGRALRVLGTNTNITERKQAEMVSNQFKVALETTHDGFWIVDQQGFILEANQAYADMSGYTVDELRGMHIKDFDAIELTLEEIKAHVTKVMTQGWDVFETRHHHKDGHEFDIEVSTSYIPESKLIVSFLRDITQRKEVERLVREKEQRYQSLFNNAEVAMFRTRLDGSEMLDCNEKFLELVERTRDEVIGKPSVVLWENHLRRNEMVSQLKQVGRVTDFEFDMRTRNGDLRHCVTSVRLFSETGLLEGSIRDITARKIAEKALRESESRLRVMLENEVVGIVTSKDRVFQWANPAYEKLLGYEKGELNGLSTRVIFHSEEAYQILAKSAYPIINAGKVYRTELIYQRKDGSYITVDVSGGLLDQKSGETLWACVDITQRKKAEAELKHIAHYDGLTGIPNRVLLADRMKQAIAQTSREQNMMAVCYLDLDGFKPINDTLGHEAGDMMLIEIAKRIEKTIRGGDTVSRLGGDEFVFLLLGLERSEECGTTLERLLQVIAQPMVVKNKVNTISASIGVSIFPMDDEDPDTLLRHADQAMYVAKQSGKNRYYIYDPAMDKRTRTHQEFLKEIRQALDQRQFELYYQPKINLRTKVLVGVEALIRWNHPERGLLPPSAFLSYIENTDLDIEIGEWVSATALSQLDQWHRSGLQIGVSINISGYHLESPRFTERLRKQLSNHSTLPSGSLQIEVLETVALNDISVVRNIIKACRDIGVGFALDDFGTGYSSLTYLSRLPVDVLKIDQSFVQDMLEDKGDMAIVQGIIALALAFDRSTVAEGIETDEHYAALLEMGCEIGQGYGIARPMPAGEIKNWYAIYGK